MTAPGGRVPQSIAALSVTALIEQGTAPTRRRPDYQQSEILH